MMMTNNVFMILPINGDLVAEDRSDDRHEGLVRIRFALLLVSFRMSRGDAENTKSDLIVSIFSASSASPREPIIPSLCHSAS